ncbi:MAG TPA: hypothetical protein VM621_04055 [Luteibacter sp.]|nr:hypothetical protein [Luteibacter sp.]HVI54214.1 hypothetical protein [Luteibacter sp.]
MKFETAMLKGFFVAGVLICLLSLGAMIASPTPAVAAAQMIAAAR